MFDCSECDDATKRKRTCPDLGLTRADDDLIPIGGLGEPRRATLKLDRCLGWYKRDPATYADLPWDAGGASIATIAYEIKWALQNGAIGVRFGELPAALHEAVLTIIAEEGRISRMHHEDSMRKARGGGRTFRFVDGAGLVEE